MIAASLKSNQTKHGDTKVASFEMKGKFFDPDLSVVIEASRTQEANLSAYL